jgi:hypothetical protein
MEDTHIKQVFNKFGTDDTQNIFTPPSLCREMLSHIEFKGDEKVLVLYNLEFALILNQEFGLPTSSIYIYTNSKTKQAFSKYGFNILYFEDTLDLSKVDMKFDIVVGNPPYQKPISTGGGHKMKKMVGGFWIEFLKLAKTNTKTEGYIGFITPQSWFGVGGLGSKRHLYTTFFKKHNLTWIKPYCKEFNVSIDICSFILQNTESTKNSSTIIQFDNKKVNVNLDEYSYLPYDLTEENLKLVKKVITNNPWSFLETTGRKPDNLELPKVAIMASRFKDYKKHLWVDDGVSTKDKYNISLTINKELVNNYLLIFKSKLFHYVFKMLGGEAGLNSTGILKQLPYLDPTKKWDNQEIYKHFNLTQEEIDLIESTIK